MVAKRDERATLGVVTTIVVDLLESWLSSRPVGWPADVERESKHRFGHQVELGAPAEAC